MNKKFQLIILVVFIATAILGLFVFSGAIPLGKQGSDNVPQGTVVLWGTVKSGDISKPLEDFNRININAFSVVYEEKSPDTFDSDLLEALASGAGPDMFFISDDLAYKYSNKIYTIPYTSFSTNTFKNNFVGAGEVFLTSKGVLAFPLSVDPLMMYYDRSILDASGVAYPPTYWDELVNLVPILNKKNEQGLLTRSTVAMGQFSNILNAKDILASLFLQSGNTIVAEKSGTFTSMLNDTASGGNSSDALKFYTDFADPLSPSYSWNKGFANSRDAFSRGEVAFYFGFASEFEELVNKNPNQDFGVVSIPQVKGRNSKLTYGHTTGIAISSFSKNFNTAFTAAGLMTKGDFASKLSTALGIAPARRDLISITPTDAYLPTFYASAFFAKSWLDPSEKGTNDIWKGMIEKVLSNSLSADQSINDASAKLSLLLVPKI